MGTKPFKIQKLINHIKEASQNAKITFFHRYIYQESDPDVLVAIHKKIVQKLSVLNIIEKEEEHYNGNALERTKEQFNYWEKKRQEGRSTGRGTEQMD